MLRDDVQLNNLTKCEFVFRTCEQQKMALVASKSVFRKREIFLKLQPLHFRRLGWPSCANIVTVSQLCTATCKLSVCTVMIIQIHRRYHNKFIRKTYYRSPLTPRESRVNPISHGGASPHPSGNKYYAIFCIQNMIIFFSDFKDMVI